MSSLIQPAIEKGNFRTTAEGAEFVDRTIWSWCLNEISGWRGRDIKYSEAVKAFEHYNATSKSVFLFTISGGEVSLAPKAPPLRNGPLQRANRYREWFQTSVRAFCPDLDVKVAMYLEDGALAADVPIFVFQKPAGCRDLLMPDPDFLDWNFYSYSEEGPDRTAYFDKACSAVFAGATSGGFITQDVIQKRAHARLRSALFFQGNDLITFRLPSLVQYDNEETAAQLKEMGIGLGNRIEWREQLQHRFIISQDGNGATCSRVAMALRSNSVLLKYDSPHQLYYFHGLTPWLHYVPIHSDPDVVTTVQMEREKPGFFHFIAEESRVFALSFLNRYQAMKYTAWLLQMYARRFSGGEASAFSYECAVHSYRSRFGAIAGALAHVANRGDLWLDAGARVGERGSRCAIEGFGIEPGPRFSGSDIAYQALLADGTLSPLVSGTEFCGTRGMNRPLYGIRFSLSGQAKQQFECRYTGYFVDGSTVGPVTEGVLCKSELGGAIEAFDLAFIPKC